MSEAVSNGADGRFSVFRRTLMTRYGEAVYRSWFSDLKLDEAGDESVTLSTESEFRKDRIEQQFKPGMLQAWSENIYPIRKLSIIWRGRRDATPGETGAFASFVRENGEGKKMLAIGVSRKTGRQAPDLDELATPLDPRLTFESFAVDDTNAIAFAAAQKIVNGNGAREILYLYGPSGVGKTHLMQACGDALPRRRFGASCLYLSHNNILTGCVGAVLSNSINALQRDIIAHDLVMLDDIHLLAGKTRTLDEVLNLIDALAGSGRQLIVAGERAPSRLVEIGFNERIADRLSGGFAVPLEPGGEPLRREVLRKRCLAKGEGEAAVADETLDLIARLFSGSMRECIGALNQVWLVYRGQEEPISAAQAMCALKSRLIDRRRKATLEDALAAAAEAFGLSVDDLVGRAQPQRIVRARHAYVMASREVLNESFPRISRVLGRDHTTAISSWRRAEALYERDKKFQAQVASIRSALGG